MSEWGQINAGQTYGVLCTDIDRAIAHMRLTPLEQMLFQFIREHCWGVARLKRRHAPWPDPVPCYLNIAALAEEWGVSRTHLQNAKMSLIEHAMIEDMDGRIYINKEVGTWRGLPRKSLEYAMKGRTVPVDEPPPGVPDRVQDIQDGSCESVPDRVQDINAQATDVYPVGYRGCTRSGTGVYPTGYTSEPIPPDPPIEERARQKNSEEKEEKIAPFRASVRDAADELPGPDSLWEPDPGPHRPTPDQVEAIFRLARQCYPATNIAHEIYQRHRWHKPESWLAAIRYAATKKPNLDSSHYIEAIAATYDRDGVPVAHPTVRAAPGAPPPPRRNWHTEMVARFKVE